MRSLLLLLFTGVFFSSAFGQALDEMAVIQLKTVNNKSASIAAIEKNVVIIFMGTDCPITQKYIARIKDIVKTFGASTEFYGVFPAQFSLKDIKHFKKEYKISIHLLQDDKMNLTGFLGATVTPEVFLLDAAHELQYRGAIDNWFYELGKYRLNTTEQYLINALAAVSKGEKPPLSQTEAIGCFIQMPHNMKHH